MSYEIMDRQQSLNGNELSEMLIPENLKYKVQKVGEDLDKFKKGVQTLS